jgi:hypothetical protein
LDARTAGELYHDTHRKHPAVHSLRISACSFCQCFPCIWRDSSSSLYARGPRC